MEVTQRNEEKSSLNLTGENGGGLNEIKRKVMGRRER